MEGINIIGRKVQHKTFGLGVVKKQDNGHITAEFSMGEKSFQFPSSFKKFLTAVDSDVQLFVEKILLDEYEEELNKEKSLELKEEQRLHKVLLGMRHSTSRKNH